MSRYKSLYRKDGETKGYITKNTPTFRSVFFYVKIKMAGDNNAGLAQSDTIRFLGRKGLLVLVDYINDINRRLSFLEHTLVEITDDEVNIMISDHDEPLEMV